MKACIAEVIEAVQNRIADLMALLRGLEKFGSETADFSGRVPGTGPSEGAVASVGSLGQTGSNRVKRAAVRGRGRPSRDGRENSQSAKVRRVIAGLNEPFSLSDLYAAAALDGVSGANARMTAAGMCGKGQLAKEPGCTRFDVRYRRCADYSRVVLGLTQAGETLRGIKAELAKAASAKDAEV